MMEFPIVSHIRKPAVVGRMLHTNARYQYQE